MNKITNNLQKAINATRNDCQQNTLPLKPTIKTYTKHIHLSTGTNNTSIKHIYKNL